MTRGTLEAAKEAYMGAEREAAMWNGFLDTEQGKAIRTFMEHEWITSFDDADSMRQVAANAARRALVARFFRMVRHAFEARDIAARQLADMLREDDEVPDRM